MTLFVSLTPDRDRYIEYLSQRDEVTRSDALSTIIDLHAPRDVGAPGTRSAPIRKHFSVSGDRLALVDALAIKWGVMRYVVVARLIDEAREADPPRMLPAGCA